MKVGFYVAGSDFVTFIQKEWNGIGADICTNPECPNYALVQVSMEEMEKYGDKTATYL